MRFPFEIKRRPPPPDLESVLSLSDTRHEYLLEQLKALGEQVAANVRAIEAMRKKVYRDGQREEENIPAGTTQAQEVKSWEPPGFSLRTGDMPPEGV